MSNWQVVALAWIGLGVAVVVVALSVRLAQVGQRRCGHCLIKTVCPALLPSSLPC